MASAEQHQQPIINDQHDNRHYSLFFADEESYDSDIQDPEGKEFYTYMRTHVIYLVTIIILYALSCSLISYFSKRNDEFRVDIEEYRTYKISTWMCAFTLAISIAAFLLLPVSITTNELTWIDDTKTKWSLLDGMWSYVFLFSNLSLFVLLPFAYFFTESEGFSGSRRGMLSRLRETCVLLLIVAIIVLGLTYTICCLFFGLGCHVSGIQLFTIWQYLPFLYSCISFIGALLLLLCTPLGISHLFTVLHQMDTMQQARKLNYAASTLLITLAAYSVILVSINTIQLLVGFRSLPLSTTLNLGQQRAIQQVDLDSDDMSLDEMIKQQEKNLMLRDRRNGPVGAFLDIVMILYLWCASLCGLYNLPRLCCLRPRKHKCSFNQIMGNCTILCLLSSALPLLARTLGMTNFDLLADFGRLEWLGNFYIVLLYNVVFLVSTTLCLMGKREMVLTINLFKAIIGSSHHKRSFRYMNGLKKLANENSTTSDQQSEEDDEVSDSDSQPTLGETPERQKLSEGLGMKKDKND